jgi:NADPH:quinone reductase-like Zn-dependent oxidoreductase
VLVQAAGSGIGSAAIRIAKSIGCTVIATAGDDEKCAKAQALGADHVVNYSEKNFSTVARRVTDKRGVDVVFEHVGAVTWASSLLSLRMGGRLVTCGSTSGVAAETNLMMLFQRQLHIFGSFGCRLPNVADGLKRMAAGVRPVLDTVVPLDRFAEGLERLESRRVFGKIIVTL